MGGSRLSGGCLCVMGRVAIVTEHSLWFGMWFTSCPVLFRRLMAQFWKAAVG